MPTYNGEKYIAAQIESILSQSFKNFKLLIRDDCSTDKTIDIIKKYAFIDNRIIILKGENTRIGLTKNIEFLLNNSSADYVMFSDQDDFWFFYKVQTLYEKIREYENKYSKYIPILVHSDAIVTDSELNPKGLFQKKHPFKIGLQNSLFRYYVQGASMIINKALASNVVPFIPNVYVHDRYIHLICEIIGRREYINRPLMFYRHHNDNLIGNKSLIKSLKNLLITQSYIQEDYILINEIKKIYVNNKYLAIYNEIANINNSRFKRLHLIFSYRISMRAKELLYILLLNK